MGRAKKIVIDGTAVPIFGTDVKIDDTAILICGHAISLYYILYAFFVLDWYYPSLHLLHF